VPRDLHAISAAPPSSSATFSRRQIQFYGARRRPLANHDVELEVLERRIEDFLHHRRETVDLVDKQDVAWFQIG
jgi:hypothetical protein